MVKQIKLRCWALGSAIDRVFPVAIASDETVGDLKGKIKEKKEHEFRDFDADALALYKISAKEKDVDTALAAISVDHFKEVDKLGGSHSLWQVFPKLPTKGHVYVVVVEPPNGEWRYIGSKFRLMVSQ